MYYRYCFSVNVQSCLGSSLFTWLQPITAHFPVVNTIVRRYYILSVIYNPNKSNNNISMFLILLSYVLFKFIILFDYFCDKFGLSAFNRWLICEKLE